MRLFYRYIKDADIAIEVKDNAQIKMSMSDVESLVAKEEAVLYDTHAELNEVVGYRSRRSMAYPSIEDQLDRMYHSGFDAWKEMIKAVKDAHPKP